MTQPRFIVRASGYVMLGREALGKVERMTTDSDEWWVPIDAWGEALSGPTKVRTLAAMTVVRGWGLDATLLDIHEEEPCA